MPRELLAQFTLAEDALRALGVVVWPLVEWEADDALGTAAARWADAPGVERVVIMTPDKDMGQCVREDGKVVQYDRRQRKFIDADGVREKFGVSPESIPDFLALVGDSADGYPGIPGWGKVSAGAVLTRYGHLEDIPDASSPGTSSFAARPPGRVAARAPRRRVPLPRAGDARHRRAAARDARRSALARRAPRGVHRDGRTPRPAAADRPRPQVGRLGDASRLIWWSSRRARLP